MVVRINLIGEGMIIFMFVIAINTCMMLFGMAKIIDILEKK